MDTTKILQEMRQQRDQLADAIKSFERLSGSTPRRGRPPKWLTAARPEAVESPAPKVRGKRGRKASARKQ